MESYDAVAKVYGLQLSELIAKWETAKGKLKKRKKLQVRRKYGPRKPKKSFEKIFSEMEQAEKDDIKRKANERNRNTLENYDTDSFRKKGEVEEISDEEFWQD